MSDIVKDGGLKVWAGEACIGSLSDEQYKHLLECRLRVEDTIFYAGAAFRAVASVLFCSIEVMVFGIVALAVCFAIFDPASLVSIFTPTVHVTSENVASVIRLWFVISLMLTAGSRFLFGLFKSPLTSPTMRQRQNILAGMFNVPDPNRIRVIR